MAVRGQVGAAVHPDPIEERIGYRFRDPAMLREALTHRSAPGGRTRRGTGSNERLEFVGDRVLGLTIAEWLFERFPDEQEGELGARHARLVSRAVLAPIAERLDVAASLAMAPDAVRAGVGGLENVRADALEALLGAVYLDGGLEPVRAFVRAAWSEIMTEIASPPKDPKTALQEWLLGRGAPLPAYEVASREGPSHAPRFVVEASAMGLSGRGEAGSKREAEREAASALLAALEKAAPVRRRGARA